MKYFSQWLAGDAAVNMCGHGFNGYNANGQEEWNRHTDMDMIGFETAVNVRELIENWNRTNARWLRKVRTRFLMSTRNI